MLINIKEVAKLVKRHVSAVDKYVKAELLPPPCHRDGQSHTNYWSSDDVEAHLPKVIKYQKMTNGERRAKPKKKKISVNSSVRPFETAGQIAANSAFNLCIN